MDFLSWFKTFLVFFEKVSPALAELVKELEPSAQQVQLRHRILYAKFYCRHKKYTRAQIDELVNLEFKDFTEDFQRKIADLIAFELNK